MTLRDTSLAAVAVAPKEITLQEFALPEIGQSEGLMRVEAVGVCGTDWSYYQGTSKRVKFPLVLGHECVGRIARIGDLAADVWGVQEGDRVVIEEAFPCNRCRLCRSVNYHMCVRGGRYGAISTSVAPSLWGGFSQYMYLHPNSLVYKISDEVPAIEAPLFIPISNGIRWVQQVGGIGVGDTIVIQGPGQHGLGCVIASKEAGAERIIVTGLSKDKKRLEIAQELGATDVIDVEREDPVERTREITDGEMAQVVVDITAGSTVAVDLALDLARSGGMIVLAGAKHQPVPGFLSDKIFFKELTIKGVYGRDYRAVEPAIRLIESGKHPLHKMSSHKMSLEQTDLAIRTAAGQVETEIAPLHVSVMP